MTAYDFTGDYKTKLSDIITRIESHVKATTRDERKAAIEEVTDAYIEQTGVSPDSRALYRLADVILHEELTDRHPDKMTREEYPIMSERQIYSRREGKKRERTKAGVVITEAPLDHAVNVAADGKNYTLPIRSFTNPF